MNALGSTGESTTMTAEITFGLILFGCLMGAVVLGIHLRRVLPEHYLSAETKDAVKLAMGLVATMSALVLGLLVTSVKGAYDTRRGEVIEIAAKVAYTDRVLGAYGPEADEVRSQFREMVEESTRRLWPRVNDIPGQFRPNEQGDDSVFISEQLQRLTPRDDTAQPQDAGGDPCHGIWAAPLDADCPIGGLHFAADARRGDLLAHAHFPEFSLLAPLNPTATWL